jgi:SAM-dependent methyltransferase
MARYGPCNHSDTPRECRPYTEDVLPYKDAPHSALSFTSRCAELCAKHTKSCKIARGASQQEGPITMALDVGCAVGGASFELARHFREVVGIDFSRAFIQTAKLMKEHGKLPYTSVRLGSFLLHGILQRQITAQLMIAGMVVIVTNLTPPGSECRPCAWVKEADVAERYEGAVAERVDRNRVTFRQGDACKLPSSLLGGGGSPTNIAAYGRHDAVLAAVGLALFTLFCSPNTN